ncbi:MAG: hypothetical protein LBU16_07195 [Treponema sp.]|jgi:hypothetical protein|nr:hypothetical protein [Treponema sp.]
MRNIVLIKRENAERVTHVSVILCGNYHDAVKLCRLVNRFFVDSDEKLSAVCISMGKEYALEKNQEFSFEDFIKVNDRIIQRVLREVDAEILGTALLGSGEAVKEHIFKNISKRAAQMLKEDMEHIVAYEPDIEDAKQYILDIYDDLCHFEFSREFKSVFDNYAGGEKTEQNNSSCQNRYPATSEVVLVFRGKNEIAETVSVVAFDSYNARTGFCDSVNKLKFSDGSFAYARLAKEMKEYEITKPILISFDQIDDWNDIVVKTALRKVNCQTIAAAIRGLDRDSMDEVIVNLPHDMALEVIRLIDADKKETIPISCWQDAKSAREKIVKSIMSAKKMFEKKGWLPEIMMD